MFFGKTLTKLRENLLGHRALLENYGPEKVAYYLDMEG